MSAAQEHLAAEWVTLPKREVEALRDEVAYLRRVHAEVLASVTSIANNLRATS